MSLPGPTKVFGICSLSFPDLFLNRVNFNSIQAKPLGVFKKCVDDRQTDRPTDQVGIEGTFRRLKIIASLIGRKQISIVNRVAICIS